MADRLEKHLVKIEQGLGGDGSLPKNYNQIDKLDWHLTKIEGLIEEGGGGGTTVVANPEMSGDEDDLVGLQVGETKYKVSSSGGETKLYTHFIASQGKFRLSIITNTSEPFTATTLAKYLYERGYKESFSKGLPILYDMSYYVPSGMVMLVGTPKKIQQVMGVIYASSENTLIYETYKTNIEFDKDNLAFTGYTSSQTPSNITYITDTVYEL